MVIAAHNADIIFPAAAYTGFGIFVNTEGRAQLVANKFCTWRSERNWQSLEPYPKS